MFEGFTSKEKQQVTLHVTLMNSFFRNKKNNPSFDARRIMKKLGDYNFGTCSFDELNLSERPKRPAKESTVGANTEYYTAAHLLKLNTTE